MSISRLVMEFVVSDLASSAVKKMTENLRHMGQEGERAAKSFEVMADRIARGVKAAGVTREVMSSLMLPGLSAAGGMEASLLRLKANLDSGAMGSAKKIMEQSRKVAGEIAGPTPFAPQQVIDQAITEQLKAGMSTKDVLGGGAQASAYLATAEQTDIATANSAILAMATKFNLSGQGLKEAADLLVRASGASEASAASLQEGLSYVTSASRLKMTPEDTLAMLSMMDKQGFKGSQGGTSMQAFFEKLTAADQKIKDIDLYDQSGQFIGIEAAITQLREYFGKMNPEQQSVAAKKYFDTEGSRTLFALLNTGSSSFESMRAGMKGATGLEEKMGIISSGTDTSWEAVRGTAADAAATAFEPLLDPSKRVADGLNAVAGSTSRYLQSSTNANKTLSHLALGAVALPALHSATSFLGAGAAGLKGLRLAKGLGGLGGLGAGVGVGKALEGAAGVQPVFVVNMPGGGILPGVGIPGVGGPAAPGVPGAGAGGGSWWGKNGLGGSQNVSMNANTVTMSAASLGVGWEIGTLINEKLIKGTKAEDYVQAALGTFILASPAHAGLQGMKAAGSEHAADMLQSANDAQDRIGWLRTIKEAIGLKVNIHIDDRGEPTVDTEGVDDVEVSSTRAGVP